MKKIFALFSLITIMLNATGQKQSQGFVQSECGIISNPSYYIQSMPGGHGGGYYLIHNGKTIKQEYEQYGSISASSLKFIDEVTGFYVSTAHGTSQNTVYKIKGDSVIKIGSCAGNEYHLFVLNRHQVYLMAYIYSPKIVFISRCSDIRAAKVLFFDKTMLSDTTCQDTVIGVPLCSGLNELDYLFKTITYKIVFHVDTISSIQNLSLSRFIIYPNPATDFIRIVSNNANHNLVNIFDKLGVLRKSITLMGVSDQSVYIGDLENGLYFIDISDGQTKSIYKIIKI